MISDRPHDMMVDERHDETARMAFVATFKQHLTNELSGGSRNVFEGSVRPAALKDLGREPNRHEIRRAIKNEPFFQCVSSLRRTSQEMIWDSTGDCVNRQIAGLDDRARGYRQRKKQFGALKLDPDLSIPRYMSAVDIHCMPGGYHTELGGDDVFAGALYDRGVHLYRAKPKPTLNDGNGAFMIGWVREHFPDLKPRRVLDMGCGIGNATVRFAAEWPEADVHGIDIGAAMLRYGNARAEALEVPLFLSQQNAEHTNFSDRSFDLIVSFLLFHETSRRALHNIFKESYRLLAPGGVVVHVDSLPYADLSPWDQFVVDWDTHYNAEPFIGTLHDLDLVAIAGEAGFAPHNIFEDRPRHPGMSPDLQGSNPSNDGNVKGEFLNLFATRD
jgi:SAM-dependent methyltransferase